MSFYFISKFDWTSSARSKTKKCHKQTLRRKTCCIDEDNLEKIKYSIISYRINIKQKLEISLNRAKALMVLHRISDKCKMVTVGIIILDATPSKDHATPEDYQIKMKCNCNIHSCTDLPLIIAENQLEMKEDRGFLILYSKAW